MSANVCTSQAEVDSASLNVALVNGILVGVAMYNFFDSIF